MKSSYNMLLKDFKITHWKLRYPVIFTKNRPMHLLNTLKLLIVSNVNISPKDTFIQDVIQSMSLHQTEIYIITIDQIDTIILPKNFLYYCWCMGVKIPYDSYCVILNTPPLLMLKCNVNYKRDLWEQIRVFLNSLH